MRAPRCLTIAYTPLREWEAAVESEDALRVLAALKDLERVAEGHPDGMLYLVAGLTLTAYADLTTAEERSPKRLPCHVHFLGSTLKSSIGP